MYLLFCSCIAPSGNGALNLLNLDTSAQVPMSFFTPRGVNTVNTVVRYYVLRILYCIMRIMLHAYSLHTSSYCTTGTLCKLLLTTKLFIGRKLKLIYLISGNVTARYYNCQRIVL